MNIARNTIFAIALIVSASVLAEDIRNLFANSKEWERLISEVEKGEPRSILRAIELLKQSDAGASSELNDALFIALKYQPSIVLSGGLGPCGGRSDPAPTYDAAINEVNAAIKAVSAVGTEQAVKCKIELQNSKASVAKFFGVTSNDL